MSGVTLSTTTTSSVSNTNTGAVELTESGGRALKLQTDTPHLVSLGGGRLSTAVTLHPIPQGFYKDLHLLVCMCVCVRTIFKLSKNPRFYLVWSFKN